MKMELGLSQQQTIKQIQTLSPQMYMSMEILCLNSLDLEERIDTELEDNVALELTEPEKDASAESSPRDSDASDADSREGDASGDGEADLTADDNFDERFEQWTDYSREEFGTRRVSSYAGDKDGKLEALSNTQDRPLSLQEQLERQVDLLDDGELCQLAGGPDTVDIAELRELCTSVIYNIDNRGYLLYSLEEIRVALEPRPSEDAISQALTVIQNLDPPGIGGRDLKECLLLQLRRDPQQYPLEERIVREHLDDLGRNRLPKIAKSLGISIESVKSAGENIASLNPRPGLLFGGEAPPFIKPDVVVEEVEGKYVVRVESDYSPRLHISSHYQSLYKQAKQDPEIRKYLKKKMDNAEWLIAAIRQRQSTLQRIANEIVEIQKGFLDHGISRLKPLKMVEVAERVGVHVSTISRAISDKYMQTPRGIFPMKFFFTGGASKSDGSTEARGSVIQRIKTLIEKEDKASPLSDIDIARKLAEDFNIKISRRTVTKYREAEGLASSRERRTY